MSKRLILCAALSVLQLAPWRADAQSTQPVAARPLQFHITFDTALQSKPYTGRVYVVLSKRQDREPRYDINNWFDPPQVLALDVKGHKPNEPIRIAEQALGHPRPLHELEAGEYSIQAIARRSLDHPVPGRGPGDLYSDPQALLLDPATSGTLRLHLDNVVEQKPFEESDRIKYVEIDSPLLSEFHGRRIKMRAGVVLPTGWGENPQRTYPVLYWIGGFGSNHGFARQLPMVTQWVGAQGLSDQVLQVVPDPSCYRGHHVFADSDNNGPRGRALIEELIPAVEAEFRGAKSGRHRYVTGISSGGWSSLWLQITYPDAFSGCWSHAPDPVDFRDFQRINLYAPNTNIYVDEAGNKRAVARRDGRMMLEYEDFVRMEEVRGPGGQIHSFEAVFSQRGSDGAPLPLFDRTTGKIDHRVAKSWQCYDIRLILERDWTRLAPKLRGKLHVYAGQNDSFFLEGAVALLKESLSQLGSDAEVVIVPAMGHSIYRDKVRPMYQHIVDNFNEVRRDSSDQSK